MQCAQAQAKRSARTSKLDCAPSAHSICSVRAPRCVMRAGMVEGVAAARDIAAVLNVRRANLRAMQSETIAILGGTGEQGLGLALRFAKAGRGVTIGSRVAARAQKAAEEVAAKTGTNNVQGAGNADAARGAPVVILSLPFEHTAATLKELRKAEALRAGQILVSMGVPLAAAIGDGAMRPLGVWQGSCAQMCAALVPDGVHVVSAFQNVPAHRLQNLAQPVECDVIISGAPEARAQVMALCKLVPGLRAVNGGPLANARIVEEWTALLIGLNIRYKLPEGFGLRLTMDEGRLEAPAQ